MPRLGASSQGESRLRMLRVVRRGDRHDARDLTVSIRFEGEFATAFLEGRSDGIIPGEILKSLVHRIVREHAGAELEVSASRFAAACSPPIVRSRVSASRSPSSRGAGWTSAASRTDRPSCSADPSSDRGHHQQRPRPRSSLASTACRDAHRRFPSDAVSVRAPTTGSTMRCRRCSSAACRRSGPTAMLT